MKFSLIKRIFRRTTELQQLSEVGMGIKENTWIFSLDTNT